MPLSFVEGAWNKFSQAHLMTGGDESTYYATHFSNYVRTTVAMPPLEKSVIGRNLQPKIEDVKFTARDGSQTMPSMDRDPSLQGRCRDQVAQLASLSTGEFGGAHELHPVEGLAVSRSMLFAPPADVPLRLDTLICSPWKIPLAKNLMEVGALLKNNCF
jgi:hypothetical protein